jgi:hypothetical protein
MRHLPIVLILTLVLVPAATAGMPFLDDRAPDEELIQALEEIRARHPEAWRRLEAALGEEPSRARWRLGRHARYARQRARVETDDPAAFALMVQQEAMEQQVRELVEQAHQQGVDRDKPRRQDAAYLEIRAELRQKLEDWFEVRQLLRAHSIEEYSKRYEQERDRLEATEADWAAARETWILRITEGGPEAMAARLEDLEAPDDLEPLAPALLRAIMRRDPGARRTLWRLAREDREALHEHLEQIAEEHPDLLAEVRAQRAEMLALHTRLRDAVRNAHETLLPHTGPDGALDVPRRAQAEVELALEAVVAADLAVARHNLERVARDLERKRQSLEQRTHNKATIVDIQLARLLEESDLYEW